MTGMLPLHHAANATATPTPTPAVPAGEITGWGVIALLLVAFVFAGTVWLQTVTGGRAP